MCTFFSFCSEFELDESFLRNAFFIKHTQNLVELCETVRVSGLVCCIFPPPSTTLACDSLMNPHCRGLFLLSPARVVFHIPDWLHHLLMTGRILVKSTLEAYTDHYLRHKLNQVVQEHRLVSLITLLRGTKKKYQPKNKKRNKFTLK